MTGANDPHNRTCFDWDPGHWDRTLHGQVQRLARLRGAHPALRRGAYRTLAAAGDCFAFARFDATEVVILAVNRGELPVAGLELDLSGLPWLPERLVDLLGERGEPTPDGERLTLDLPAKGARLLHGGID